MNFLAMPPETANLLPGVDRAEWRTQSPQSLSDFRSEVTSLPAQKGEDESQALFLQLNRSGDYARWTTRVDRIKSESFYEFSVWQRSEGVDFDNVRAPLILSWYDSENDDGMLQRDYVDQTDASPDSAQGWHRRYRRIQAPRGAKSVRIDLGLRWAGEASIWWKAPQLKEVQAPASRKVRVATTRVTPPDVSTIEVNTKLIADMLDRVGKEKPDIVLFSENLVDRRVPEPMEKTVQPIPGPLTDMLSEKARLYSTYVATTLHEVDANGRFYNTAVLIDREGSIVGKYRKVHLTMSEADAGLFPGNEYPVFETDFGRVGIMICWDNWFPESARALRQRGAEMILLPIAGDGVPGHWDHISRARAFDNSVYLISSATVTDNPSRIINPAGEIVGEATGGFGYTVNEIDLNQEWRVPYLSVGKANGEARSLYREERRPDTYGDLLKR